MVNSPRTQARPASGTVIRSGPLSWIQEWHWFERTVPAARRVNPTPLADHCHVPPPATVADVHRALSSLTACHEALRTTVDPLRPVQHVHRPDWAPLPVDCADLPVVDAGTLDAATAALAARPIDPGSRPPWHARVLLHRGKPCAVVLAVHHVVIDGWGLAVLVDQLHDLLSGNPPPPQGPWHPLDLLDDQHPKRARAAERAWLARYATNPTGVLAPFGGTPDGAGRHRLQHRSVRAHADLDRLARLHRASPETVMLAALALDVATRTGEHRFLASVVVSHRTRAALRTSVAVRALTVPVQIDLRPGAAFGEVVTRVAAACAAAYRHGHWRPAELVAAQARMDRRRGALTVPAIEYNCYAWPREYVVPAYYDPPDTTVTWATSAPDEPCDTLYVDLGRDAGVLTLDVTVGDHLLDAAQAEALPVRLCALLRRLAASDVRGDAEGDVNGDANGDPCLVPARPSTPPAAGWWRAPRGWVFLPAVEDVLRGHPGVLDATAAPGEDARGDDGRYARETGGQDAPGEGGRYARKGGRHPWEAGDEYAPGQDGERLLVAYARTTRDVTAEDLHRHLLDHLGDVPGLFAPDRYVLTRTDPGRPDAPPRTTTVAAGALRIACRPPATPAERALAAAVLAVRADGPSPGPAEGPGSVDMNRCLADHGVTLVAVPRLLAELHRSGLTGIASDELAGTASLGHLAAALEPLPPRAAHRGGVTPP
ncbi:condensation domain-containing protein [Streptomyces sp. NPDC001941]|uniref:condensation domain-containing protein n=1 Tax=Streptomyces sp. NPDC001941 TaxID=3154659 RepID=UPI0033187E6B